jgi:hypothetical protein
LSLRQKGFFSLKHDGLFMKFVFVVYKTALEIALYKFNSPCL